MAKLALRDAKLWFGEYDLSGHHNMIELRAAKNALDSTAMGDTWAGNLAGVRSASLSGGGFWDMTSPVSPDYEYWTSTIGATSKIITVSADGGDAGEVAYTMQALNGEYSCLGAYGDPAPFSIAATADGILVRGMVIGNATATGTGSGTGQLVGAIGASSTMYAALHVTAVSGFTSATIKVQSDDNAGFTSATDRITFTAVAGVTSEWKTLAGAVTDTYWRYTISAMVGTSMTFAVVVGIV